MTPHDPSDVFALVLRRLQSDVAERHGLADVRLHVLERQERPFSQLVRLAVSPSDDDRTICRLYVKVFRPKSLPGGSQGLLNRIAKDFETTQRVHASLAAYPDLDTVPPVACYPDLHAIVTEQVDGPTLMEYLGQQAAWFPSSAALSTLCDTMERIGRWLQVFQATGQTGGYVTIDDLSAYVAHRLNRLRGCGAVSRLDLENILGHVAFLGSEIPPHDLSKVAVHCDFALGNILVAGPRIVVLDFAMAKLGTRLHDLTRLCVQMDLLTLKPQFRTQVIGRLERAFLAGFDQGVTPGDPLFRLLSLLHRINHLTSMVVSRTSGPQAIYNGLIKRRHRRWIATELATGRRALESV